MPPSRATPGARYRSGPVARSRELLAAVRVEGNAGRNAAAVRLARKGLQLLEPFPDERELRSLLLINLASFSALLGESDRALQLLDEAVEIDPASTPAAYSTRGYILGRARMHASALEAFDEALRYRPLPDNRILCTIYLRRGVVNTALGRLRDATSDLMAADSLSQDEDLAVLAFMARHNLGWVRFLRGDLPGALAAMAAAQQVSADKPNGEPELDRARVLMAAGLLADARDFADRALNEFTAERLPTERAEALLVVSELCLLSGIEKDAEKFARLAVTVSGRHQMTNVNLVAKLEVIRARSARKSETAPAREWLREAVAAGDLAAALLKADLPEDAAGAYLLEAEGQFGAGKLVEAETALQQASTLVPRKSLAITLHSRLISGRIALAGGNRSRGLTELRKGLDELADFQARFGSQDMQAGASVHGRQLAKLGLRAAIEAGSPAAILQWLERGRAVSTRLPVVNPPADPELADMLGALRFVAGEARAAALGRHPDPALERRLVELRRKVRARSWIVAGSGRAQRPMTLTAVQRLLAADQTAPTLIAYITGLSAIRALVITADKATFQVLGGWDDDADRHRKRAADLDMLAASRIPASIRKVAAGSLGREFHRLSAQLVDPLADRLGSGPVVVVATGEPAIVPWGLLPALEGRAVSVSSSVTSAMAAGGRPSRAHVRGVLAVAGPDVENGAKEAQSVAGLHVGAGLLVDEAATGEAVLAQIPAGGLLHIAAHGHHETESPLFSSVLLADGPLYGYDIAPNPHLPDQVVLSSCDVGRSNVRPGGEPLGLAAALLRSGVSSVIAGVSRISDTVAATVMSSYHEQLLAGGGPAAALAAAIAAVPGEVAPFSCFGSGA